MFYVSMALSVFMATSAADDVFELGFVDALIMSIYFQAVALLSLGYTLNSVRPSEMNFDVYKGDATTV